MSSERIGGRGLKNGRIIFLFLLPFFLAGCAGLKEAARGIAGNSTKVLYDTRSSAACREFDCSLEECRVKVSDALKAMQTYVYAQEGDLTAVFVTETDTTPVGIFVSAAGSNERSKIEVSSPSTYAKEIISRKLFSCLDAGLKSKKIEVHLDAIEGQAAPGKTGADAP